jgi:hypothetical protein
MEPVLKAGILAQLLKWHEAGQFIETNFLDPFEEIIQCETFQFIGVRDVQEVQVSLLDDR